MLRDPQLKYLPNGTAVVEFGVGFNHKYKTAGGESREETLFLDLSAFGKQGEVINEYFTKGKPIFVVARLRTESWEDKQGGGKRSKITGVLDRFEFVGDRQHADQPAPRDDGDQRQQQRRQPAPSQRPKPEDAFAGNGPEFTDDSIPFRAMLPARWI